MLHKNGDVFRIMASATETTFTVNGVVQVNPSNPLPSGDGTWGPGQFLEVTLKTASQIQSNAGHPILVTQFATSKAVDNPGPNANIDPDLMIVYPFEQYLTDYTIASPSGAGFNSLNYVNLIAPNAAVNQITLDGTTVSSLPVSSLLTPFTPIGTSGFQAAQLQLTGAPGSHHLSAPNPFGVLEAR